MKKKFKLLTSIASLGLALALMTFGVLAAGQHSLQLNHSVSFNAGEDIAVKVSYGSAYGATATAATEGLNKALLDAVENKVEDGDAIEFSYSADAASYTYTWAFKVENLSTGTDGGHDIAVSVTTSTAPAGMEFSNTLAENAVATVGGDAVEFIVTLTVTDFTAAAALTEAVDTWVKVSVAKA